jgi:type II secretory pathway component GspD/PulD (secretin)
MRLTYRPVTKPKDLRPMGTRGRLDPGDQTGVTASARAPRLSARRTHLIGAAVAVVMVAGGPATALLTSAAAPSPSVTPTASAATDDWSQLLPTTAPLPRDSAEVAYDTSTSTVVISGGEAGCSPLGREV